jgi:hypothetical protein
MGSSSLLTSAKLAKASDTTDSQVEVDHERFGRVASGMVLSNGYESAQTD